ncbi:MAG: L-aspartate oxidase [Puniceicoccales bacterium]|jgi:L-aspartate oxidase|nr:L-aspartate oxidase [Puniceicoccales bacterium]
MSLNTDAIVVGTGIAGLSFALKLAAKGWRVALVTKKGSAESNTNNAQGGIACVAAEGDNFEAHVRDTLVAGDGLCDEAVTRAIVEQAPERVRELAATGVAFSRDEHTGNFDLGREGGHSQRRILHVKDLTGAAIEEALLAAVAGEPRITLLEHHLAIDLILERERGDNVAPHPRVLGLYALDCRGGRVLTLRAPVVVLATGGVGQVYQYTTNPDIATGDGIALAFRAGAPVANMEFIQFHPTALYTREGDRALISEAVRGEGAILRGFDGADAFMSRHDPRADLAPRDIVARAIDSEMKKSGAPHVWLDIRGRGEDRLMRRFPHIFATCLKHGVNMERDLIPVVPAAHYLCGGVRVNINAETPIAGLYAAGEVACTGLHGANRLASNSLLEAVVLAHNGATAADTYLRSLPAGTATESVPDWVDGDLSESDERVVLTHNRAELRQTLWDYVGIVRTTKRLLRARSRIQALEREIHDYYWNFKVEPALLELRNLALVARLVVECALQRKESRGLHYTLDYPERAPSAQDSELRREML